MYKNYLSAILSGFLLALAWPTYGYPLLLFIGFVPLLLAEKSIRTNFKKFTNLHVFLTAYLSFLIWNLVSTWWIWNSTKVGGVFAIVVNTLLMTLVFQLYHLIAKRKPQRFSLIFLVAIWIAFEKFHLIWDFSWPWLNLGNAFSDYPQWIQWYEYTGVFGGTLWIWIVNISVFNAFEKYLNNKSVRFLFKKLILSVSLIVLGIFISLFIYTNYQEKGEKFTAILLQPNTDPYTEKYHQSHTKIADDLIELTQPKIDAKVKFVLAPETVFSNHITLEKFYRTEAYRNTNAYFSNYPKTAFLTGIDLYKVYPKSTPLSPTANHFRNTNTSWYESYNAALFLAPNQNPKVYHKSKLVVGVEHFPFRKILQPLLGDVMIDLGGSISTLTPQKEPVVFSHPTENFKAAPIICYESIYGEYIGKYTKKGANFFAIITNDSWWGETEGHRQLLSYARLRAVEHRRAIARSANSGISAFINQKGEILSRLAYKTRGALKGNIQANNQLTFYSKHGDYIARIAIFVAALFLLIGLFVKKRLKSEDL